MLLKTKKLEGLLTAAGELAEGDVQKAKIAEAVEEFDFLLKSTEVAHNQLLALMGYLQRNAESPSRGAAVKEITILLKEVYEKYQEACNA